MHFLHGTEKCTYFARVTEVVAQIVDVSSDKILVVGLDFVAFDEPLDRLYVHSHLNYLVKETIFKRPLRTREDSYFFIN